jgi:two-component system NarL family sensor kinase
MQAGKNDIIIFLIVTTAIILLLAGLIITLIYLYQKKQLAYQQNLETLKLDHEKNLMAAQLEIQEDTFQHISREIHDNISLSLTLAKLHLNTLNWNDMEKRTSLINSTIDLISQSITNLSGISKSLNSDIINSQGLITAIENEVHNIRETGLFAIDLHITGDPVYMDMQKELIIFRIIQEAFNNIIKHAKATHTGLTLHYDAAGLNITIRDNGSGFILPKNIASDKTGKAGLKNMETRSKMIGGKMQLESIIDKGTVLSFSFPY